MSVEFTTSKEAHPFINLTPLIDVIFQLLVFFMLTSTFAYPALKLELPKAQSQAYEEKAQRTVLSVDAEQQVYLNKTLLTNGSEEVAIRERLSTLEDKAVYFRADKELPYQKFVEMMEMASRAGASQFNIIHQTQQP